MAITESFKHSVPSSSKDIQNILGELEQLQVFQSNYQRSHAVTIN